MLFNSIDFALFLPIVFVLYWFVFNSSIKRQNILLLVASYIFYGWWDYRFLTLVIFSTVVDFLIGRAIVKQQLKLNKKLLVGLSLLINLGLLGFFKYYNFFIENFSEAFSFFGVTLNARALSIVLPVGISFYTFQTLSYTIDVYRGVLKPTNNIISFAAFVTFFPQLVAGPIERATHLLPQFFQKRVFNYALAVSGLRQILWGLFKKVVIADNCAVYANKAFNNIDNLSGSTLAFGALFFAVQIYGDFSGYSDIAIGTSRLFSFDLKKNFNYPYFSRDIAEFWRRWHISLSTWFRDYLYIPLGGSRGGVVKKVRNVFVIFLVSGFWHGANWTFIVWGALNALFFIPLLLNKTNRNYIDIVARGQLFPKINDVINIVLTFSLTVLLWVFFRAESMAQALLYLRKLFSKTLFSIPSFDSALISAKLVLFVVVLFFVAEWLQRDKEFTLDALEEKTNKSIRWSIYVVLTFAIIYFQTSDNQFIYFQF